MYAKYAELRDSKNMKDIDVSRETGIPASTFTDWKNGKSSPKIDKLIKIADLFEVSLDDLVRARYEKNYTKRSSSDDGVRRATNQNDGSAR
jgi:repressor LexA